jgi:large subunit ribosomal protein L35
MPKMKTHSGAAKRFKKLKSNLVKGAKAGRRHLMTRKSASTKRNMRRAFYVGSCDIRHVKSLLQ